MFSLTRRSALLGLTAAVSFGRVSLAVAAAPTEKRFIVVILRGALDGMAAVVPYGDPALVGLRGEIVPPDPGQQNGLLDLGGFYGLHPSLTNLHAMYRAGEAMPVHAIAGPTRVRSHFEAQDCLESGADHRMTSGWLNRAVAAMPAAGTVRPEGDAVAINVSVPLLLRGPALVANWAPHGVNTPPPDLYAQIAALNETDHLTGPAIAEGLRARGFSASVMTGDNADAGQERTAFPALARAAGEMLRAPNGPRFAALEIGGWDTHVAQVPRLKRVLEQLDAGLAALKEGLGDAWRETAGTGDDRIRPHCAGQWHQGHGPRHRRRRLRAGRRGGRRPGRCGLARPWCRTIAGGSRPCAHHRSALGRQGHAGAASRPWFDGAGRRVPGKRNRPGTQRPDPRLTD